MFADFIIFLRKSNFFEDTFFKFRVSINLSWGHVSCLKNVGPDRFSRFTYIGYKQTNTRTDRHAKYIEEWTQERSLILNIPPDIECF